MLTTRCEGVTECQQRCCHEATLVDFDVSQPADPRQPPPLPLRKPSGVSLRLPRFAASTGGRGVKPTPLLLRFQQKTSVEAPPPDDDASSLISRSLRRTATPIAPAVKVAGADISTAHMLAITPKFVSQASPVLQKLLVDFYLFALLLCLVGSY